MTKITARHSRSKGEEEATACIRDQRDALLFVIKLPRNINSKLGPGFHSGSHSHFDFSSILELAELMLIRDRPIQINAEQLQVR